MSINNQIHLFFFNSITDRRAFIEDDSSNYLSHLLEDDSSNYFSRLLESQADHYLEEFRYWFKGKQIKVFKNDCVIGPVDKKCVSLVFKIQSIVKAVFYFLPASLLKGIAWSLDFSYIKERNNHILKTLEKQTNFTEQCARQSHILPSLVKNSKMTAAPADLKPTANNSLVALRPSSMSLLIEDLKLHTSDFLSVKDQIRFSLTCKTTYKLIAELLSHPSTQSRNYPSLVVEALTREKLVKLPFLMLTDNWRILFEQTQKWTNPSLEESSKEGIELELGSSILYFQEDDEFERDFFPSLQEHAIQKIESPEGPALFIQIKDNISDEVKIFLIAKVKGKWSILTQHLSGGMWLFLNDIRFHAKAPNVMDYLKRLFNGEPCGNFPDSLNSSVSINYQIEKASDLLKEGPRVCKNGTPVIQLYPAHKLSSGVGEILIRDDQVKDPKGKS